MHGDGVAVVDERLPVVLGLLEHPVLLQDVDDSDEEQEILPTVVASGNAAPHVLHAAVHRVFLVVLLLLTMPQKKLDLQHTVQVLAEVTHIIPLRHYC